MSSDESCCNVIVREHLLNSCKSSSESNLSEFDNESFIGNLHLSDDEKQFLPSIERILSELVDQVVEIIEPIDNKCKCRYRAICRGKGNIKINHKFHYKTSNCPSRLIKGF